uniref:Uncharacterized protein n=1 Tax=Anguilla anguilla TaxID=7936 RepID=A0A0E9QLL0_ANGAN
MKVHCQKLNNMVWVTGTRTTKDYKCILAQ